MKTSGWLFLAGLAGALFSKNKTIKFISTTTAVAAGGYFLFSKPPSSINGIEQNKDFCPICGEKFYIQCKCAGFIHTLDDVKRGHGKSCKNGHTWYYNKNSDKPIVWPDNLSLQGMVNIPKTYKVDTNIDFPIKYNKYKEIYRTKNNYCFISEGPKGKIPKVVTFDLTNENTYEFSIGDYDQIKEDTDFDISTNNNDMMKIFATSAAIIYDFLLRYPTSTILIAGNTSQKNIVYKRLITNIYSIIKYKYTVLGAYRISENKFTVPEIFDPTKNFNGFYISIK